MGSTGAARLEGLQVMRAIAALMVVVHHALTVGVDAPDWLFVAASAGVDIFFVISGFIMMVVSFPPGRAPERPWSFLRKRVARIYPLYWAIAGAYLLLWSVDLMTWARPDNASALSLLRAWLLVPTDAPILQVAWTLVHEMNFYLVFALMLLFGNRATALFGVTALLLLQIALARFLSDDAARGFLGNTIALEFCLGLALGYAHLRGLPPLRPGWLFAGLALAFIFLAPLLLQLARGADAPPPSSSDERVVIWGLPAVVLIAASAHWNVGRTAWGKAWLLLGDASYAIYLTHMFVIFAYQSAHHDFALVQNLPQLPLTVLAVIASAALGVAAHLVLERPLTNAARKLLLSKPRRPQGARTATTSTPSI